MKSFLNMLRSLTIGLMVLSFFLAVTISSCTSTPKDQGSEDTESVEAESEEHPSDSEEHPTEEASDDEHPSDEEHPTDSTATEDSQ